MRVWLKHPSPSLRRLMSSGNAEAAEDSMLLSGLLAFHQASSRKERDGDLLDLPGEHFDVPSPNL